MISKKMLAAVLAGATLVIVTGCAQQAATPVTPAVAHVTAPVETPKTSVVQPVVDNSAAMIVYNGDTYTFSYPKAWEYQLNKSFGNADTFIKIGDNNLPILVVGKPGANGDQGMCLKSIKKETMTIGSGLKFGLDYMVPDTASAECKDAFSYLKDQDFVQVNISNTLKKDMSFTYAKSDETDSVAQLKAVLDSVKQK